jgi:hypothetical protein
MKIGMTGHQNIGSSESIRWVSRMLEDIISRYKIELGYTSLAIGADQLFARLLKKYKIQYIAIIPSQRYERTFENKHLKDYFDLLESAKDIILLDFKEPCEVAYYEAGKLVVDQSDILIAIWNGRNARGLGGTGDIVKYAMGSRKKIIHINPNTYNVSYLFFSHE